jgi:EAL domain-containing protein (putative c-di-GMP-specific phosphodiesterase class I)
MDHADTALYQAKDNGRGCFAYFSQELTQKALERIALESNLRRAIEQKELRVYFQPQIDIKSGQLIGAEALLRWHDPVNGLVMPSKFITLAEETGLIVPIGEWVLRETCRLGQQWLTQGLPPITLAVNVSAYQFRRSNMNALVTQVLEETGFPVSYLELEITESGLMYDQQQTMSILNHLHEQGVRLAIDDFGTGYSSLAYLKYFPIDVLKIDKTFIDDIPFLQGDMAITTTIIAMAHHLGFKVLAEGVETPEQLAFLREQGCDNYQGYLYSKALPAHEFAQLLANKRLSK